MKHEPESFYESWRNRQEVKFEIQTILKHHPNMTAAEAESMAMLVRLMKEICDHEVESEAVNELMSEGTHG